MYLTFLLESILNRVTKVAMSLFNNPIISASNLISYHSKEKSLLMNIKYSYSIYHRLKVIWGIQIATDPLEVKIPQLLFKDNLICILTYMTGFGLFFFFCVFVSLIQTPTVLNQLLSQIFPFSINSSCAPKLPCQWPIDELQHSNKTLFLFPLFFNIPLPQKIIFHLSKSLKMDSINYLHIKYVGISQIQFIFFFSQNTHSSFFLFFKNQHFSSVILGYH